MGPKLCFLSMIVAACFLCSGGCQMDSAARIAMLEAVVAQAQAASDLAGRQVTALQGQLEAAQTAGADSATLAAIRTKLDEAFTLKPQVDGVLQNARDSLAKAKENPGLAGELEAYGSIGVSALGVFLAGYFKRKQSRTVATLGMVTQAVEKCTPEVQEQVKTHVATAMVKASRHNAIVDAVKQG